MKNVLINKIVQYVVTENQLMGYWKRLGEDLEYSSLSEQQLMDLAKKLLDVASHHELEQHLLGGSWRSMDEVEGKMIAEDDSDPAVHVEYIDTNEEGIYSSRIIFDRVLKMKCDSCGFEFMVENLEEDPSKLKCPKDGGLIKVKNNVKKLNKK